MNNTYSRVFMNNLINYLNFVCFSYCMINPLYKKVDNSVFKYGVTIPKSHIKYFEFGKPIKAGTSRPVNIVWGKDKFQVRLSHVKRNKYGNVYQIRWDSNKELINKLRRTFIHSYIVITSKKILHERKKSSKQFRTIISSGEEVFILTPMNSSNIKLEVFVQIKDEWDPLFKRLVEDKVFDWITDKTKDYLIVRSTKWIDVKEFNKHKDEKNVIYYLVNSKKKHLYIGKAAILGKRVKPGRTHQGMSGDWDKFRYDVIKPEYALFLERIEDHTIRAFASVLKNKIGYPTLGLSDYTLVNINWKKL